MPEADGFLDSLSGLQIIALLGFVACLISVARRIDWQGFREIRKTQHLVFGTAASVFFLWLFRAGIYDGLDVHFLWLTALTLMLGFRMAVLSATLALIGITLVGKDSLAMLGVNGLLGVLVPIGFTYLVYILFFHKLPRHFFVYIFVCAFFPGAIMIATKMALLGSFYVIDGVHTWEVVKENYLVLIPLLLFPEGMLNGMTMTLLVIYKPDWVYTFYDKHYLDKK